MREGCLRQASISVCTKRSTGCSVALPYGWRTFKLHSTNPALHEHNILGTMSSYTKSFVQSPRFLIGGDSQLYSKTSKHPEPIEHDRTKHSDASNDHFAVLASADSLRFVVPSPHSEPQAESIKKLYTDKPHPPPNAGHRPRSSDSGIVRQRRAVQARQTVHGGKRPRTARPRMEVVQEAFAGSRGGEGLESSRKRMSVLSRCVSRIVKFSCSGVRMFVCLLLVLCKKSLSYTLTHTQKHKHARARARMLSH